MKSKESPDLEKPFVVYTNPGCFYDALCTMCLCFFIGTIFFMILFRQLGVFLIIALVSGAGIPLFRWLGARQQNSQERLLVVSDEGISLPPYGMAKAVYIPWERFSSATARRGVHQDFPPLVLEYQDPSTRKLRTVDRSLAKSRYEAEEVIEIIEQYRERYWETRKKGIRQTENSY